MNLFYIDGGSRWKIDEKDNFYTDATYSREIWQRYHALCNKLTVALRCDEKRYTVEDARKSFNYVGDEKMKRIRLVDIYNPKKNAFRADVRKKIKSVIKTEIQRADKIIIRSLGNFYTNTAAHYCIKLNKPFLVEVTGFVFESLWYHSSLGKLVAPLMETKYKSLMKCVDWAIYVTDEALQKRYPCRGKSIGCSDVELEELDERLIEKRGEKKSKLILGTAAFLDVNWKGQEYVVRAIAELEKCGISNIEYRLIGGGSGDRIKAIAKDVGVSDRVVVTGAIPHNCVFTWLDDIDVYIQPSFQEGLCRSIVEAMSRGCPVICSSVGGNYELVPVECLFEKGNVSQITEKIMMMLDEKKRIKYARISFDKAKKFDSRMLEAKRNAFYQEFANAKR